MQHPMHPKSQVLHTSVVHWAGWGKSCQTRTCSRWLTSLLWQKGGLGHPAQPAQGLWKTHVNQERHEKGRSVEERGQTRPAEGSRSSSEGTSSGGGGGGGGVGVGG